MSEPTSITPNDTEAIKTTEALSQASASDPQTSCESHTTIPTSSSTPAATNSSSGPDEEGLIKEMKNFDNLLKMISVYRDNPDLRGNPGDRNIEEIAKVLSNFIGDDPDDFLRDHDDDDNDDDDETSNSDEDAEDNQVTSNGSSNPREADNDK